MHFTGENVWGTSLYEKGIMENKVKWYYKRRGWCVFLFFKVDLLSKIPPFPELLEPLSTESHLMTSNRQQFKHT